MEGQESGSSDSYEETPKIFGLMHTSRCTWVCGQKSRVHVSMGLKVVQNNKQVFLRDEIGTSKYNTSPWGIKSLQRDREGHKYVINNVW